MQPLSFSSASLSFSQKRCTDTYPTCLDLLATGKIDVKPMITHHFPLDQINEAINTGLTDPTAIKVIVHPNQ